MNAPIRDRLEEVGALSLGKDPSPDAVETVLRRWASTLDGADRLRIRTERDALADLPAISAGKVDAALESRCKSGRDETKEVDVDPEELLSRGQHILDAPDQLKLFRSSLRSQRFAGSTEAVELVHVALCSRALERPLGLALFGPSAAGKTFTVKVASRHHPDDAVHDVSAMSERYLAYADFPTEHRYVSIAEASALHTDGVGATIIRELSWNRRLRYGTVVRTEDGPQAVTIEKPGPTGLITTSTKPLDEEIATRLIAIQITDSPEQTRKIIEELAATAAGESRDDTDLSAWHAASDWLVHGGDREVVVPYARAVGAGVPDESVRMRRDFEQVMTVVRSLAFMHQRTRPRDEAGRIVATKDDYANAYRLLAETMAVTLDRVSDATRETVEAVEKLAASKRAGQGVSYQELADELGLSRSGAWRRGQTALQGGYLANAEDRDGYPAKLVTADPLPEPRAVLPDPKDIPAPTPPPESTQHLNASEESPGATGKTTVESPVESGEALNQQVTPLNRSLNGPTAQADGEKSGRVEPLSGDQGGLTEGGSTCPSCGGGKSAEDEVCGTCRATGTGDLFGAGASR